VQRFTQNSSNYIFPEYMVVIHVEGKKIKGNTARLTLIRPHISHIKTLVKKKKDK